ncbi:TonB-dependent receptor domain-containing protein [Sphingobium xenophagum]|uniref:TonB-dependent receptor domain-containing protein n=1 Tax=Sphingobium xenophagum TaxID=121428 RepID=UPI000365AFD4|nr:TonB-dependent receptor [Sphingobium xenophagum]
MIAGATHAVAQTPQAGVDATAAKDDEIIDIVVTGSYLTHNVQSQGALTAVSGEDLLNSSRASVAETLAQLPSTSGNIVTGGSNDQGNSPVSAINLRGLGPRATLVLLNGQRQVSVAEPGGQDSFSVDVNTLVPAILIQRVDVLKDGASALYGSDAVAGVVNFITDTKLNGLKFSARLNLIDGRSRKNGNISVAFGSQGERTSVVAAFEYAHQDQVFTTDIYGPARIAKFGQTSAFANPATFFVNGVARPDPLCGSSQIGGVPVAGLPVNGQCRQDLTLLRGMIAQIDRGVGYVNVKHELSDALTLNVEGGASMVQLRRFNSVGFPVNTATLVVPANNPGNPFGAPATMNYRWGSAYLGLKSVTATRSNTYKARGALNWNIDGNWKAEASAYYGINNSAVNNGGYASNSRLQAALNCKGGASGTLCFNPFASSYLAQPGSALYNSQALIDYIAVARTNNSEFRLSTFDARVTGKLLELWNGMPVQLALGVQRRSERATQTNDAQSKSTDVSFGGPTIDYDVSRTVNAAYAELHIPLAATLDINFAGRYEDSNPGSGTFNPKAAFGWRPLTGLSFSGSIGRSERAPGLLQFIGGSGLGGIPVDPITQNAQNGFAVTLLPSTGLDPESAVSWNLAADYSAQTEIGNLKFGADYFNIDFKHLITGTDVTGFILADPTNPAIRRDPVSQQIQLVTVPGFFNANRLKLSGLDFNARLGGSVGSATPYLSIDGTWMFKYDFTNAAGVSNDVLGTYNTAVAPVPKLNLRGAAGVNVGGVSAGFTVNYKSKFTESTPGLAGITEERSFTTFDFAASIPLRDQWVVNLGVLNIFNKLPPAQANSIYTANGLVYPITGRSFSMSLRGAF